MNKKPGEEYPGQGESVRIAMRETFSQIEKAVMKLYGFGMKQDEIEAMVSGIIRDKKEAQSTSINK